MKAQARKILALIMAMVMCLSLAAPAMAADVSAADETVALEVQAEKTYVKKISETKTGYEITLSDDSTVEKKWTDADSVYATVTSADYGTPLIGTVKKILKTVSATAAYTAAGEKAVIKEFIVDDPTGAYYKPDGDFVTWTELNKQTNWFGTGKTAKRVSGYVYQEKQDNGKYVVYFKLSPVDNKAFKNKDWVYLVAAESGAKKEYDKQVTRKDDLRDALASATTINANGVLDGKTKAIADAGVTLPYTDIEATGVTYTYNYGTENCKGVTLTDGDGISIVKFTGVTSATFDVRVTETAKEKGKDDVTTVVKDAAKVKELLEMQATGYPWSVTSVVAASGDFFTVTVIDLSASVDKVEPFATIASNVRAYTVNGDNNVAGLIDLNNDGFYKAKDEKGTDAVNIASGVKLYGEVAVKADSIDKKDFVGLPATTTAKDGTKFYVFDTLEEMQWTVSNRYCIEDKNVSYVRLVLNEKKGSTNNKLVKDGAAIAEWYTDANVSANKTFVESGTVTFAKNTMHGDLKTFDQGVVKTIDEVAGTCKKPGTKTVSVFCKYCGEELSSETTEVPINVANVVKMDKDDNVASKSYVMKDNLTAAEWGALTTAQKAVYELKDGKYVLKTTKDVHYIAKSETKTTNATKAAAGSKVTTYTCNLGEVHDDLTVSEEVTKVNLEHSGNWDYVAWSTQNTSEVRNPSKLYGFTVTVADTDVEDATLPINATGDAFFKFEEAVPQTDGTYASKAQTATNADKSTEIKVYSVTNNVKTYTNKYYRAIAIVKDIKLGEKECKNGSAVIEVQVYETAAKDTDIMPGADHVEKSIANKKATLLKSYTQKVEVPAEKSHVYVSKTVKGEDGKTHEVVSCSVCGTVVSDIVKEEGTTEEPTDKPTEEPTVEQKSQKLKISKAKITVKAKSVKKKAKSYTVFLNGDKTDVKWSSSNKKVVTVKGDRNGATVTVKKKAKKGTYKITVKAKETEAYKAASKTMKVVVK